MALSAHRHGARSLTPSPEPGPRDLAKRGKDVEQDAKEEDYYSYSSSSTSTGKGGDNVFMSTDSTFNMVLYCLKELNNQNRLNVKSIQRAWIHGVCGNAKDPHVFGTKLDTSIYDFAKVCMSVFRMTCLRAMNINEKLWPAVSSPCDKRNWDILRYEQVYGPPVIMTQTYAKARRIWSDLDRMYPHFSLEMCAEDLLDKRKRSIALDNCMVIFRRNFQEVVEVTVNVDMDKGLDRIYNCDVACTLCRRMVAEGPEEKWMSTLRLLINGPIMSIKKHYKNIKSISSQRDSAVECCTTYLNDLPETCAPAGTSAGLPSGIAGGLSLYGPPLAQSSAYGKPPTPAAASPYGPVKVADSDYQRLEGSKAAKHSDMASTSAKSSDTTKSSDGAKPSESRESVKSKDPHHHHHRSHHKSHHHGSDKKGGSSTSLHKKEGGEAKSSDSKEKVKGDTGESKHHHKHGHKSSSEHGGHRKEGDSEHKHGEHKHGEHKSRHHGHHDDKNTLGVSGSNHKSHHRSSSSHSHKSKSHHGHSKEKSGTEGGEASGNEASS